MTRAKTERGPEKRPYAYVKTNSRSRITLKREEVSYWLRVWGVIGPLIRGR